MGGQPARLPALTEVEGSVERSSTFASLDLQ